MNTVKEKAKEKKWILKNQATSESISRSKSISEALRIHPIVARLLYDRGYTDEKSARTFICMESEMLCDPFDMKDVDRGIERIRLAIQRKEKITVYGDYDVDGVTSVCTLYLYLKSKGADVEYYIPNRVGEGYGVSEAAIDAIKAQGSTLIITVDTGITANEEVLYAKSIGVDFVITDHHECRENLPLAEAVINPHRMDCCYPFKELAGVGVVFKLVSAYEEATERCSRKEAAMRVFSSYADLVAIGTIADVMPIKSENRIIVSYGLKMIEESARPGLLALMNASVARADSGRSDKRKRTKITSGYVGYTLAPRINAAGRIKSASLAVELFLANDIDKASEIAEQLCAANRERQSEENRIMQAAYDKIEALNINKNPVIVLDADNWHHGVIGIVASRITEKYSRPSILVSFEGNEGAEPSPDDVGKGSGRSIKGMNLVDALYHCSEHLVKFGGHELAAGLSVTRAELDNFRAKINEYANMTLCYEDMTPVIDIDCEISFSDLTLALAQSLQILEPYGVGNPMPVFAMYGVWVNDVSSVSDGKHSRIILGDGQGGTVTAMYFSNSPSSMGIYSSDRVDVIFNIDVNEWLGRRTLQLIVKDIRLSVSQDSIFQKDRERFNQIWNGGAFSADENLLPTRDDFAAFYRYVATSVRAGNNTFAHRDLAARISKGYGVANIGYVKLKIIIKVLQELNVLGIEEISEEVYRFSVSYSSSKADLEKSNLLRRLRAQQRRY